MLANRLDRIRWRQFVFERVDRTPRRSFREKQKISLSHEAKQARCTCNIRRFKAMTPNERATDMIFVVL